MRVGKGAGSQIRVQIPQSVLKVLTVAGSVHAGDKQVELSGPLVPGEGAGVYWSAARPGHSYHYDRNKSRLYPQ